MKETMNFLVEFLQQRYIEVQRFKSLEVVRDDLNMTQQGSPLL
jgi:maleate cis-trans isomerase